MVLVRHVSYYYLRSFQKIASHGSYDEMLLTTNKRWNYFIILPPAAREVALPASSPSQQCAGVFAVVASVALVARRRAGVVARVVIVVAVVVSSAVGNVVVHRNHRRCHRRCRKCCRPLQSLPLSSSLSSIAPSPSTSSLLLLS